MKQNVLVYGILALIFMSTASAAYASLSFSDDIITSSGSLDLNLTDDFTVGDKLTLDSYGQMTIAVDDAPSNPTAIFARAISVDDPDHSYLRGIYAEAGGYGTGDYGNISGLYVYAENDSPGNNTNLASITAELNMYFTAVTTNAYGLQMFVDIQNGSTLTNLYGISLPNFSGITVSGVKHAMNYANKFIVDSDGNIVSTGTVTATNFITSTGLGLAKKLSGSSTIDFASISNAACATSTFTLTGAATTDSVATLRPAGLADGMQMTAWISASNTVKVQLCNSSGGAVDPASLTYGVTVVR